MAREPLRWDNVAMPQFNNSALAVASGAFSASASDASKLAEALRQQELDRRTRQEQDALNRALRNMYANGQADATDLTGVPAGVDMTKLTQAFRDLGTYNAGISESEARTRASNAATALSEAELKNLPAIFQSEQDLRAAQRASALASADSARAALVRTQGLAGDEQLAREDLARRIKGIDVVRNIVHGTGEGSLRGTFENSIWPTKREEALAAAATESGLALDKLPPELIQQIDNEKKKGYLDEYINAQLADPELKSRLIRDSGLSEPEFEQYTGYGQDLAAQEKSLLDLRTKLEEERQIRLADEKEWWKATGAGDNSHVILNGAGEITMGEKNTIPVKEAETVAARLGFDPKSPLVAEVRAEFPHRQSFQTALMMVGVPQGGWFGDQTKFEFDDEGAVRGRLQALRDTRTAAITAAKQGPGEAPTGTPDENFLNSVRAAASGFGGTKPEATPKFTQDGEAAARQKVKDITAGFADLQTEVQQIQANLPKSLQTNEVRQEIKYITEALAGKRSEVQAIPQIPAAGLTPIAPPQMKEIPLTPEEISQRLLRWKGFVPVLNQRIEEAKISAAEKDELQKFFERFNAKN